MWAEAFWNEHAGAVGLYGLIITALAAVFAVILAVKTRHTKSFDIFVLSDEPIITRNIRNQGGLKVSWHEIDLSRPRLIVLRVANTGRAEIRRDDFAGPPLLLMPGTNVIYATRIGEMDGMRQATEPATTITDDVPAVSLPVTLYNRANWIDIQILVDVQGDDEWSAERLALELVIAGQTRESRIIGRPESSPAISVALAAAAETPGGGLVGWLFRAVIAGTRRQ